MKRGMYMFGLLALFGIVFAAAATLDVSGGAIQAGQDLNLKCDPDVVRVDGWGLETDDGLVSFVRIHDIHPDCVGNDLWVSITENGSEIASGGPVAIPSDTCSSAPCGSPPADNDPDSGEIGVRVSFTAQAAEKITDIKVFIEGPFPKTP